MWKSAPPYIVKYLSNNSVMYNNHRMALTPKVSLDFIFVRCVFFFCNGRRWFSHYVITAMLVDANKRSRIFPTPFVCPHVQQLFIIHHCYPCLKRLVANHLSVIPIAAELQLTSLTFPFPIF